MKKTILGLSILALALTACGKNEKKAAEQSAISEVVVSETIVVPTDSSATTATITTATVTESTPAVSNWSGKYAGVLPCANCEGIKTTLVLNDDKTYELSQQYLGKGNNINVKGTFMFDQTSPAIIQLDKAGNNLKFSVADGYVQARAVETGEEITGPIAKEYRLKKEK